MPVLSKLIERFKTLLPASETSPNDDTLQQHSTTKSGPHSRREESVNAKSLEVDGNCDSDLILQNRKGQTKRKAERLWQMEPTKRRKTVNNVYTPSPSIEENEDDVANEIQLSRIKNGFSNLDTVRDRKLMPPPPTPSSKLRSNQQEMPSKRRRAATEDFQDDESEISYTSTTTAQKRLHESDPYDMEQARRHAAAVTLPANSGIWTPAEQNLFYHLALRGFEPLLPQNWMLDFKTLPLSLFAHENTDARPLIHNMQETEFRAIRSLRELIETGKDIRDRKLASPGFRTEAYIEKAINKYIHWALADAGFGPESQTLPVYVVVRMKLSQTTSDTIAELTRKLHDLAASHRKLRGIYPSIESDNLTTHNQLETRVIPEDIDGLPILTGLMIISSVIVLFTFNAHTHIPNPTEEKGDAKRKQTSDDKPNGNTTEEPGLRLITTFDFSNSGLDVWNALSVAIVAIHIREVMIESNGGYDESADHNFAKCEAEDENENENEDEDPDL